MKPRPQTIQIYLPQGDPSGIRQAEITTRTVRVFEVPRPLLPEFREMPESKQVGLYFLFGAADEATQCYIGQTGNVGQRLAEHAVQKDFWERALVAVSLTNTWTSTHVAYLEWLSISRAASAARYQLVNGNQAVNPHTPVPLEAECQEYMETVAMLMATLGYPVHQELHAVTKSGLDGAGDDLFFIRTRGIDATAYANASGLVVSAGSIGNAVELSSASAGTKKKRQILVDQGVAEIRDGRFIFLKDYQFGSPSGAAGALLGGSINGRVEWKDASGRTFEAVERARLRPVAAGE